MVVLIYLTNFIIRYVCLVACMPLCVFLGGGGHICVIVFVAMSVRVCHRVYTWAVDGPRSGCVPEVAEIHEYGSG